MENKLTYQGIKKSLAEGRYAAVYFLQGTAVYYIDQIVHYIETHALPPKEKSLNLRVYYGKEQTLNEVLGRARCLPMMGTKQVIIVKEAQEMYDLQHDPGQRALAKYLENANPQTILVFAYRHKELKKKNLLQRLQQNNHVLFTTGKVYDSQIRNWIAQYVAERGCKISFEAISKLQEMLGSNLSSLANELHKIMLNLKKDEAITEDHVTTYVSTQREYDVFALQKAIGAKKADKAFQLVDYFKKNAKKNPAILVVASLTSFFLKVLQLHYLNTTNSSQVSAALKVHPYFLKDYEQAVKIHTIPAILHHIQALYKADLQLKGIDTPSLSENEILRELVARLVGSK